MALGDSPNDRSFFYNNFCFIPVLCMHSCIFELCAVLYHKVVKVIVLLKCPRNTCARI